MARRTPAPDLEHVACVCGSVWFDLVVPDGTGSVTLNKRGAVVAYEGTPHCAECGTAWNFGDRPELRVVDEA